MAYHVLIMAGGRGERLWPLSRKDRPKQLLSFDDDVTLLRRTYLRVRELAADENIHVITSAAIVEQVRADLPELPHVNVMAEPCGRNTAPCIAFAASRILARDKDAVMAVLPSDHLITAPTVFNDALRFAGDVLKAHPELLVTIGIKPSYPETGYGYIAPDEALTSADVFELRRVKAFHEKPDEERARGYLEKGYLWNAGMFVWRADSVLAAIAVHLPAMHALLAKTADLDLDAALNDFYAEVESVSIDFGLMEHAANVAVIPAEFGWNDIGSWDALGNILAADDGGNVARGPVRLEESHGNVVLASGKKIVLLGLDDLVVVEGDDAILICPRRRSQDVSRIAKTEAG